MKLYDLTYGSDGDGLYLQALSKTEDGKKLQHLTPPFDPYCYILEDDFSLSTLKDQNLRFDADAPDGYVKVVGDHPKQIGDYRRSVTHETFEADVPYVRRVLIDEGWGVDPPDDEDILFFDIEVDPRGEFPDPELAKDTILSIACKDGAGEEWYFTSTTADYPDAENPEKAMFRDFVDLVDEFYVVSGYNSLRFDMPYIKNRAKNLGVSYDWDRIVHLDMYGLYKTLTWTGAKSFKLEDVADEEFGEDAFDFIGHEYGLDEDMTQIYDWWQDDPELLKEYNATDTLVTQKLDDKYSFVDEIYRLCSQSHTLPSTMFYSDDNGQTRMAGGQAVDALILRKAEEWDVVLPNKGKYADTHDFPGGEVLDPISGLHDDVITVDFSSMYPNIIRALNLGPNTWIENPSQYSGELILGAGMVDEESSAAKGGFVPPEEEKSILAAAVEDLMDIRFEAKGKKKAAEPGSEEFKKWENIDAGLKAILNTMYGVFASPYHRYYQPGMSENVTETGQYMVRVTRDVSDEVDGVRRVIYGDTDSVIVQLDTDHAADVELDEMQLFDEFSRFDDPPIPDPAGAVRATSLACVVADEIERLMNSRIVSEMNAVGEYLELDLDDVYRRFYIGDGKKYYFGHRIVKDDPRETGSACSEIKITGFEAIRNNWPDSASDFQRRLIEARLFDEPTGHLLEEARHKLFTGQFDLDMAQRTSLRKPVDDYDTPLPHTRAAEKIREQYGHEEVRVGDKIPYLKYGPNKTDITHAYNEKIGEDFRPNEGYCSECDRVVLGDHEHEIEDYPHFRDKHYGYMFDKYFRSSMNRIGIQEFEQTGLEAFA